MMYLPRDDTHQYDHLSIDQCTRRAVVVNVVEYRSMIRHAAGLHRQIILHFINGAPFIRRRMFCLHCNLQIPAIDLSANFLLVMSMIGAVNITQQ